MVPNIENVMTLKMNLIAEKTIEADSLENENIIDNRKESKEETNQIGA